MSQLYKICFESEELNDPTKFKDYLEVLRAEHDIEIQDFSSEGAANQNKFNERLELEEK